MASYDCYVVVKHISAQTFSYRGRRVLIADLEAYVHGVANKVLNTRESSVYAVDTWPNDFDPTTLENVREHWNSLTLNDFVKQYPRCPGDLKFQDLTSVKALVAVKYVCAAYIFTRNISTHAYLFITRFELEACPGDAARVYDLVQKTLQKDATVQVYSTHTWPDTIDPSVDIPLKIEQQWSLLDDQFIRANCASCSEFSDVDIAPRMLFIAVVEDKSSSSNPPLHIIHEDPYSRSAIVHKGLYYPFFAKFKEDMAVDRNASDFTVADLDEAMAIIQASGRFYPDERERVEKMRHIFNDLPSFLTERTFRFDQTAMRPDGYISTKESGNTLVAIVELKNEIGEGGSDPLAQAECCYVNMVSSPAYARFRGVSCCPVILVGIAGPHLIVSGAVFAHRIIIERLTHHISLVPGPEGGSEDSSLQAALIGVAKLCRALKACVQGLKNYYENLKVPDPSLSSSQVSTHPSRRSSSKEKSNSRDQLNALQHGLEVFIGPYLTTLELESKETVTLSYERHLSPEYPEKPIFCAKMNSGDATVVVKFSHRYCEEAHKLLANLGLAPQLHYCERHPDAGNLFVIVMEYVEPARDQQFTAAHKEALRTAVKALHDGGLVHGDLRRPNILLKNAEELMVIDFDWSGPDGEVRYPIDINLHQDMGWHEGVGRNAEILKIHDNHLLNSLTTRLS